MISTTRTKPIAITIADAHQPTRMNQIPRTGHDTWATGTSTNRVNPAASTICWTWRVRGRRVITVGMRLISQIPSGSPMIVIIASQAIVETIPVSHQPMKMNHSARTSSPGPSWTSTGALA